MRRSASWLSIGYALIKPLLRNIHFVCCIILVISIAGEIGAQEIIISTDQTQPPLLQIDFRDSSKKELPLNVMADDGRWHFVLFIEIPDKTSIRVKDARFPYQTGEAIASGKWYAFTKSLPLMLTIEQTAGERLDLNNKLFQTLSISYQFGRATGDDVSFSENDEQAVRKFTEGENVKNNIQVQGMSQFVLLRWAAPPPSTNGGFPWWVIILVLALLGAGVLSVLLVRRSAKLKGSQTGLSPEGARRSPIGDLGMNDAAQIPKPSETKIVFHTPEKERERREERVEENTPVEIPTPSVAVKEPEAPRAVSVDTLPPRPGVDGLQEFEGLRQRVEERIDGLQTAVSKINGNVVNYIKPHLDNLEKEVEELKTLTQLKDEVGLFSLRIEEFEKDVKPKIDFLIKENSVQKEANLKHQEFEDKILLQMSEQEKQFQQEIEHLKTTLEKWEHRDSLYAGMLGLVLGKNVELLREENFDAVMREIGENLNRLLREDVPRADGLQGLQQEAATISTAFETAVEKMCATSNQVESKLKPYVQHANHIASDLKQFHSQLENRQLNLNIHVSAHTGAREPFLAELGVAIKREIDKLRDPQTFWKREMERLATSHIIAAVDIYDKEVPLQQTPNGEVEKSLSLLFSQARLKPIVPQTGDPFRPAEQSLIQMVPGPPANSQRIARVVSRGFAYTQDDGKERLIRKAGVEIYR